MTQVRVTLGHWSFEGGLPASLQEALPADRLYIIEQLIRYPAPVALQRIAMRLLKIPKRIWRKLADHQRVSIAELFVDLQLGVHHEPLIEQFEHKGVTYCLPRDSGFNLRAKEFAIADDYFADFAEDQTDENMMRIVATYARERESNEQLALKRSDTRKPLHSRDEVEQRVKRLEGLDPAVTTAVFAYAGGVKKRIHEMYASWLFEESDNTEEASAKTPSSAKVSFGWWGTFMDVAKEGVFGSLESVHDTFIHDICVHLVQQVQRQRELRTQQKAKSRRR